MENIITKPYLFEYQLEHEKIVVEAEDSGNFYLFRKGSLLDFFQLPEITQKEIVNKIDEHFFMEEASASWGK